MDDVLSYPNEKRSRLIAAGSSLLVIFILLLIALWIKFTTPIPPFPETGNQGIEINFGNYVEGTGDVESDGIGNTEVSEPSETSPTPNNLEENTTTVTSDDEPTVNINKNETKTAPVKTEPVKPVKEPEPKPSNELSNALDKLKNKKSGNAGGDGNSGNAGNSGDPSGNPNTDGQGGSGGGSGTGNFPGYSLTGRKMIKRPEIVDDSHEEGKVVVEIIVDESGKVIKATPGERGSTTTNAVLYAKARQAALSARFNPSPEGAKEQRGTITFVFILD